MGARPVGRAGYRWSSCTAGRAVTRAVLYAHDADAPAGAPCDRCGADLCGAWYAMRPAHGVSAGETLAALRWSARGAREVLRAVWCLPCAGHLARDGVLLPRCAARLAADALGARQWAQRYASLAPPRAGEPFGAVVAAWRAELLAEPAARALRAVPQLGALPPVWWTEPVEPLSRLDLLRRSAEIAEAFGVRVADITPVTTHARGIE